MIEVKNLNKTFKVHKKKAGLKASVRSLFVRDYIEKQAIQDMSFTVDTGEIVGLIGSNGAGKTTLTKILSGIINKSSGDVSVNGFNPWDRDNAYRSQMSVIMGQKAQLWWDLPAMDGLLLLKEIYQIRAQDFYDMVEYLSECLQIKEQLNIQVRRLSLGERMKVELMAALIHAPKVVYLDEPTIGLDLSAQKAVRKFIQDYRKEHSPTMMLTSHYMEDIEQLCERVIIMREGQKVFDGQLSKLQSDFSTHKIIQASCRDENFSIDSIPKELGSVSTSSGKIIINSPRDKVMEGAKYLINNLNVSDLTIQEDDIGNIIEKILKEGHS